MNEVICIGSSSKDIFFPVAGGKILNTPEELTSQKKLAFELGAKFQADNIYEVPGGCAANVAQGLSRLKIKTACYTKIGNDHTGKWIRKELKKEGVDVRFLQVDRSCRSDLSAIIVDRKNKEHLIFFNRDANKNLELNRRVLKRTKKLFVSALNGDWENHFDVLLEISQSNNIGVYFNPGQRNIKDNPAKIFEMIKKTEILILNKDEAIEILQNNEIEKNPDNLNNEVFLVKCLNDMGARIVALTDGDRGAWLFDGKNVFKAKSKADKIVDTLGAGDSFSSGFLAGILSGESIDNSLRWGISNSLSVIRHYGAKRGLLDKKSILEKFSKVKLEKLN